MKNDSRKRIHQSGFAGSDDHRRGRIRKSANPTIQINRKHSVRFFSCRTRNFRPASTGSAVLNRASAIRSCSSKHGYGIRS